MITPWIIFESVEHLGSASVTSFPLQPALPRGLAKKNRHARVLRSLEERVEASRGLHVDVSIDTAIGLSPTAPALQARPNRCTNTETKPVSQQFHSVHS